jgi:cytochrome c peroxidase
MKHVHSLSLSLFAIALFTAAAVEAQSLSPKLRLPVELYDYTLVRTFAGPQRLRLGYSGCAPSCCVGPRPIGWVPQERPVRVADHIATLGRVLFYDRRLSRNRKISCASCHQQSHAFADPRRLSRGFLGGKTRRNSIALVNVGGNAGAFFWDGRAKTLEQMVLMPIQDPVEMGMELGALVARLRGDRDYRILFRRAFGDVAVTPPRIATALAGFVRALGSFRSKFDLGLRLSTSPGGAPFNFTAAENRGKRIFRSSCATCHTITKNWSTMPLFQNYQYANNGLDRGRKRDDPGREGVTRKRADRSKFRMPSLRNIELTAPYMHDGRFRTLEQVVAFYANRVRSSETLDKRMLSDHSSGHGRALVSAPPGIPLTGRDRADLVAFLKTLTDKEFVKDPRFSDPFVRHRGVRK